MKNQITYVEYSFASADITDDELENFEESKHNRDFWNASSKYVEQRAYGVFGPVRYVLIQRTSKSHPDGKIVTYKTIAPQMEGWNSID